MEFFIFSIWEGVNCALPEIFKLVKSLKRFGSPVIASLSFTIKVSFLLLKDIGKADTNWKISKTYRKRLQNFIVLIFILNLLNYIYKQYYFLLGKKYYSL